MLFVSTRDSAKKQSALRAILSGISSEDGGLYVPSSFPSVELAEILDLLLMDYPERAAYIMHKYLDEFDFSELKKICKQAYSSFDYEDETCAPITKLDDDIFVCELWHGATSAFKDMALSVLPYLFLACKEKLGIKTKTLILTATSGDTGKAALSGFSEVEGTKIAVIYPRHGVSEVQRLQMVTESASNALVIGIDGNFDDAQATVKELFADKELAKKLKDEGYELSSANSINFGRLLPQIVYYFSSYADLIAREEITIGDEINFCVPTGNFGNILAGYYAKRMGLPVNMLICASNQNNVLTDFFDEGKYDKNRKFHHTLSPSMDILVSGNLERLLFEISGKNSDLTKERMTDLKEKGEYSVSLKEINLLKKEFFGGYSNAVDTSATLRNVFNEYGYLVDPHTAVGLSVLGNFHLENDDYVPTVVMSTASPYKFADSVLDCLQEQKGETIAKSMKKLQRLSRLPIPENLDGIEKREIIFDEIMDSEEIREELIRFSKLKL